MKNALSRARQKLVPASVLLTLTHRCQLACAHCYQAQHDSEDLTTAELVRLFDELAQLGTLELIFTGGEALLRKDLLELIAEARKRTFAVTLFTNGGPVTPEIARRLRELRVMSVEVSLHAAHASVHDGFVGRRGAFEHAVRAIELLDDQGLSVLVKTNVVRCNAGEVLQLEQLFASRPRVQFMSDVLIHGRDDGVLLEEQRATPAQAARYFADRVALAGDEELRAAGARLRDAPPVDSYQHDPACGAGRTFASIQPNGDVLPCVHTPGLVMGNLRERSFSELWLASPAVQQMRAVALGRFAECAGCEFRHVCAKCPALSLSSSGALTGHSKQVCDRTKAYWGAIRDRLGDLGPEVRAAGPAAARSPVGSSAGSSGGLRPLPVPILSGGSDTPRRGLALPVVQ